MQKSFLPAAAVLVILIVIAGCPVQAFTAKSLDISVLENGDATISLDYDLTWVENIAVFSRVADPGAELTKALRNEFRKNVEVVSVSNNHVQVQVQNFAMIKEKNGTTTLNTPSLSFKNAQNALNRYWFSRFITPDFTPDVSRVSFPDGYFQEYYNADTIPSVSHPVGTVSP